MKDEPEEHGFDERDEEDDEEFLDDFFKDIE